ncbi:uncharacterized protein SPAPADRAFT_62642 [Spathaspora passalidarum NRRL Y-27907]|uniref:Uncharacterized protein n=1 Tax=Spathaspora passalidarum (strain NRRL Y-27907 / 11-Y1) TaxID=619300 RepID=G3AT00_SPAPN|nr:uncharacterized protein SPAPADRAFT_62642 [Spathaspora passalidarum NRRL Y-27907]EGW30782.1 hypothetical protein SPAPADRAFT_62642 [Spathaspora passalidarum NRRL Y-27907]
MLYEIAIFLIISFVLVYVVPLVISKHDVKDVLDDIQEKKHTKPRSSSIKEFADDVLDLHGMS